jgi:hypothetical protein
MILAVELSLRVAFGRETDEQRKRPAKQEGRIDVPTPLTGQNFDPAWLCSFLCRQPRLLLR